MSEFQSKKPDSDTKQAIDLADVVFTSTGSDNRPFTHMALSLSGKALLIDLSKTEESR